MLATDNWCVRVNDRVYGPYSSQQLRKFVHEGRLGARSLIAPAGSRNWREAQNETSFSSYFGAAGRIPTGLKPAERPFGRRDDETSPETGAEATSSADMPETGEPQLRTSRRARPLGQTVTSRASAGEQPAHANFVIVFDVVSAATSRVEQILMSLGPCFRLADNVVSVSCTLTAIGVRNAVAPYLRPHESIFVIDTTHGRTSWQNYAPETHAKITAAYMANRR